MRDDTKRGLFIFIFLYTICLVLALKVKDVEAIGPKNTEVGLAFLNEWFRNLFHYGEEGYFKFWYVFTQILGYVSYAVCAFWSVLYWREVIKTKGWNGVGVDKNLMATWWLYLLTMIICLVFSRVAINYRPLVMPGKTKLAVSFPSIHVILFIIAWGSTIFHVADIFSERKKLVIVLHSICTFFMVLGIIGRMISGVNWFTDILGGIGFGLTLLLIYSFFFDI